MVQTRRPRTRKVAEQPESNGMEVDDCAAEVVSVKQEPDAVELRNSRRSSNSTPMGAVIAQAEVSTPATCALAAGVGSEHTPIDPTQPTFAPGASRKCNCKRSKCLQLYCECFSANVLCDASCKCVGCANTADHADDIQKAMKRKLRRSKKAFDPKFAPAEKNPGESEFIHVRGCNCKRSKCKKKYCECFQAGVACNPSCKCVDCENDGSLPHLRNFGVHDWMLTSREATKSAIGVESVMMVLPAQDFGGGHSERKRKHPRTPLKTAGAVAEAPDRKFFHQAGPSWNHHSDLAANAHAPVKMLRGSASEPAPQRRRIHGAHRESDEWDPLHDSEEFSITPEILQADLLRVSDQEALKDITFSANELEDIGLTSSRDASLEIHRQSDQSDELRISGFSTLLLDQNCLKGMRYSSQESDPKCLRSSGDNRLSSEFDMRMSGISDFRGSGSKPATLRSSDEAFRNQRAARARAATSDVNPVLRYDGTNRQMAPSLYDEGMSEMISSMGPDQLTPTYDVWIADSLHNGPIAITENHSEEPRSRESQKSHIPLAGSGDPFLTDLLAADLLRVSGEAEESGLIPVGSTSKFDATAGW